MGLPRTSSPSGRSGRWRRPTTSTCSPPAIEAAIAEHGKIRLVFELGPKFDGYSAGAAWEDLKLWAPHLSKWERCAVVTDHRLIADAIRAFALLMPGEVKVFAVSGLDEALGWAAGRTVASPG
jgi:hypothetical protein